MKNVFYGILIGVILTGLVGFMLFDNFKTKLVVNNLNNTVNQIIQVLNKAQQQRQPARIIEPETKK